ncbi:hypothetical protein ACH5RR_031148 [Cinchona calisaya]|uniref:Uncharacterized protein n=1 Tax=Cinchona calisaya TaxID=153742 RepID=A0ABD2YGC9_9GENT
MDEEANINSPLIDEVRSVDDEIDTNEGIASCDTVARNIVIAGEGIEINSSPINDKIDSDNNPSMEEEEESDTNCCETVAARNVEERDNHVNEDVPSRIVKITVFVISVACYLLLINIPLQTDHAQIRRPKFWIESPSIWSIEFAQVFKKSSPIVPIANEITAGWQIRLGVTNPPSGWSYGNIAATIYYQEEPLCVTMFKREQHHAENHNFVLLRADPSSTTVVDVPLGTSVIGDINSGSSSDFSVRLHGNIKQEKFEKSKNGGRSKSLSFSVLCRLDVQFLSAPELMGDRLTGEVRSGKCKTISVNGGN